MMRPRCKRLAPNHAADLALVVVQCLEQPALAEDTTALPDPKLQARYEALTQEFRCMQCQNNSIADSPAGLASDLRRDFFFSSRRRHTSCLSDWSSDVCSSD